MSVRRRWVYTSQGEPLPEPIEVDMEWRNAELRAPVPTEGIVYGNLGRATDGTPIDTRRRHREYMKQNGLTIAADFSDDWRAKQKSEAERADTKSRRETVARAYYEKFKP